MYEETEKFLEVVYKENPRGKGKATTVDVRRETGMSNNTARYQFEKLEDMGYISEGEHTDSPPHGGSPPKLAVLTDEGRDAIQRGEVPRLIQEVSSAEGESDDANSVKISQRRFEEISEDMDKLTARVDILTGEMGKAKEVSEEIEQLREEINQLQSSEERGGAKDSSDIEQESGEELTEIIERTDRLETQLQSLQKKMQRIEETLDTYGDRMGSRASKSQVGDIESQVEEIGEFKDVLERWTAIADINMEALTRVVDSGEIREGEVSEQRPELLKEKYQSDPDEVDEFTEYLLRNGVFRELLEG